jgi:hypothetical protein
LYDLEGVLGPEVISFVDSYIDSLLAWDIAVYFHRNPDVVVDAGTLASKLGRRTPEVEAAALRMCETGLVGCEGGRFSYEADPVAREQANRFAEACADRNRRLALIALVLHRIGTNSY